MGTQAPLKLFVPLPYGIFGVEDDALVAAGVAQVRVAAFLLASSMNRHDDGRAREVIVALQVPGWKCDLR